jgi:hypothetical protein
LMRQRGELMFHNNLAQHEVQRQHVCGACGHIMIPGDETLLKLSPRQTAGSRRQGAPKKVKAAPTPALTGPTKSLSCGHCGRVTKIALPAPGPAESQPQKPTANASSKTRAKNRKGGLHALLSGQQKRSTPTLSLADFMG